MNEILKEKEINVNYNEIFTTLPKQKEKSIALLDEKYFEVCTCLNVLNFIVDCIKPTFTKSSETILNIAGKMVKNIVCSYFLFLHGFYQEANQVLRNVFELCLISIEVSHDMEKLDEWNRIEPPSFEEARQKQETPFAAGKLNNRIQQGKQYNVYFKSLSNDTIENWRNASNLAAHEFYSAPTKGYYSGKNRVLISNVIEDKSKLIEQNNVYKGLIWNIVQILVRTQGLDNKLPQDKLRFIKQQMDPLFKDILNSKNMKTTSQAK